MSTSTRITPDGNLVLENPENGNRLTLSLLDNSKIWMKCRSGQDLPVVDFVLDNDTRHALASWLVSHHAWYAVPTVVREGHVLKLTGDWSADVPKVVREKAKADLEALSAEGPVVLDLRGTGLNSSWGECLWAEAILRAKRRGDENGWLGDGTAKFAVMDHVIERTERGIVR